MVDGRLWDIAPALVGGPLAIIAATLIVRTVRDWGGIMARWNERQRDKVAERAGDWTRLREEIKHLSNSLQVEREARQADNERCQRDLDAEREARRADHETHRKEIDELRDGLAAEKAERVKLQAIIAGMGEVRQRTQEIVAADRAAQAIEDKGKKP